MLGGVPADHLGDDVEQLTGHGDDTFAVALGRADHQQSDDLAVGALVVADAQVGQFAEFFDAKPSQAQRFNDRPLPEGGIFVLGDPDKFSAGAVEHSYRWVRVLGVGPGGDALPGGSVDVEAVAGFDGAGGV